MERARDFRDKARDQASGYREKAKHQVVDLASRTEQAARDLRGRVAGGGPRGDQEQEKLSDEIRRGREEAVELGKETADIVSDLATLVKEEIQLAKAEMSHEVNRAVRSMVWGIGAGAFSMVMLIFLFAAFMMTLNLALSLWISAYITAGILAILVGVAGLVAFVRLKQLRLAPKQTIESMREDVEWARSQMRFGGR